MLRAELSVPRAVVLGIAVTIVVAARGIVPAIAQLPTSVESQQKRVNDLVARADPVRDDWDTESFQARASVVLRAIESLLESGGPHAGDLDEYGVPGAQATELKPRNARPVGFNGGFRIIRWNADGAVETRLSLVRALANLRAAFVPEDLDVTFKIVAVTVGGAHGVQTEVRYEARGRDRSGLLQQTALWNVDWTWPAAPDLPRVATIELIEFQEASRESALFADRTSYLLRSGWEDLRYGADYWFGRIDALGEPNLMGHQGIAVGDVNGDGFEDLYVGMGTGQPNRLYVRQPDGTALDVAEESGVAWLDDTKGVLFADMDNDGDQDLVVAIGPTLVLGMNDGSGVFSKFVSMRAPTPAAFYSISAADYDLDGDLDLFAVRYVALKYGVSVPVPFHDAENGPTNHLMRNDRDDGFTDVTHEVGLNVNNTRFSLIGAWGDYDNDGDPDLYVANDFGRNNLYRNDEGVFVDVAGELGVEDQAAGMGAVWHDYDNDGDLDLYVTNMYSAAGRRVAYQTRFQSELDPVRREQMQRHSQGNTLFENIGDAGFRDTADVAGVRMGRWGWGGRFVDLNDDGLDDLVLPNGFLTGPLEDDL